MREDIDCGIAQHKCNKCKKSFPKAKDAAYHQKHCEQSTCNICSKDFSNRLALRRHMAIHEEKYKCEVCQKSFAGQASLRRHLQVYNGTKEKGFACFCCDARLTTKSNLKRHSKAMHYYLIGKE
jgi:stress-induced morphogen